MAATEELKVVIRTVADTSGAQQASAAIRQTQQQLTTAQQGANAMLRSVLAQQGATLQNFNSTVARIRQMYGTAPTLGPGAFGIGAGGAGGGGAEAATGLSLGSLTRFAGAAAGASLGIHQLAQAIGGSVQAQREHERVSRATVASYGQSAQAYTQFATQLEQQTGFTRDSILEAALSARTLSVNYGLTTEQTQKLIRVSADLAQVRGIGVAEAFERVQSAIRGEAEASEYLGLTLNDTYIKNNALNGSIKTTFETMTDQQKAQIRYNELLKQTADFAGLANTNTGNLDGAMRRAGTSAHNLQLEVGKLGEPAAIAGFNKLSQNMKDFAGFLKDVGDQWERLNRLEVPGFHSQRQQQILAQASGTAASVLRTTDELINIHDRAMTGRYGPLTGPIYLSDAQRKQFEADQRRSRRILELNTTMVPSGDSAQQLARLAYLDQVDAAVREVRNIQQEQTDLQHESVNLAAQEARIRLSMLPTAERLAALQRQVTEQQIRARIAALPASQALENAQAAAEHARLILADFAQPLERRQQALRDSINLQMRTLPGLELGAFEANEPARIAGQAAERAGLEEQLFQVTQEGMLAQVTEAQETNRLLGALVEQRSQAINLTINLSPGDFRQDVYNELVDANAQSQTPPATQYTAIRRSGPS